MTKQERNAKRNKQITEKNARQKANLEALQQRNRQNVKIIPKDHPLSPQIADKTVLPNRKPLYPVNHG